MMKEIERMSKLSDKDKLRVQNIQEGLSGNVPMDDKWVRATVEVLKGNPNIFRTLLKGKGAMFGTYMLEGGLGFVLKLLQLLHMFLPVDLTLFAKIIQNRCFCVLCLSQLVLAMSRSEASLTT